ncbi:hypothetical protein EJJ20_20015 [Pseudomonas poae]|nr:hypothetical protein EJJ20_20015 [Pseudomonas poae]
MKKFAVIGLVALLSIASFSASACPKGTHPTGGTGSHHKGGTCSNQKPGPEPGYLHLPLPFPAHALGGAGKQCSRLLYKQNPFVARNEFGKLHCVSPSQQPKVLILCVHFIVSHCK